MRLGHQMLVDLRSGTELAAYYTGDYETKSIETAIKLIRPDAVVAVCMHSNLSQQILSA
jgi:hypothetical protein